MNLILQPTSQQASHVRVQHIHLCAPCASRGVCVRVDARRDLVELIPVIGRPNEEIINQKPARIVVHCALTADLCARVPSVCTARAAGLALTPAIALPPLLPPERFRSSPRNPVCQIFLRTHKQKLDIRGIPGRSSAERGNRMRPIAGN